MGSHSELMVKLAEKHNVIEELIGNNDFHYVDYPLHGNVGDLLILQGTLEFFRKKKLSPSVIAPFSSYSPRWVSEGCVVVFHGGGNLGDLYRYPQFLREKVIQSCHGNRIIILPQTIYFQEEEAWERCRRIFSAHPDLHLFVRDERSFELGRELTPNVYLVPDMAHQLYPLAKSKSSNGEGVLAIQRLDDERTGVALNAATVTDWPLLVGSLRSRAIQSLVYLSYAFYLAGLGRIMLPVWHKTWFMMANKITGEAVDLFERHEAVVSDRLHAHILACLLDMPNKVHDNSYGKNSSYIKSWTISSPLVSLQADRS